ncbi:uncharacterized protein B0H18DRAFT_1019715 [Fomitopsis serialis]|uniref:uncharacterized protein n=1 Tax=Fomitopsis serialis TaxID=139415 RepID=UPI0020079863|nr:uncharacterized protein B0H18DRAFT_1019715 [Neoantrodia serialis]KAH9921895.1 hypothetical protein B0H18DRAFT_1019715 [Neoantrodia serialis]
MPSVTSTTQTAVPGSLNLKASTGNLSMSSSVPSTPSSASPSASFSSSNSTLASLRGLYPRAARAFLQRNVALTHSLLTAAFALVAPPPYSYYADATAPPRTADPLASQRRKWEILRITFETTLYAAPPQTEDPDELPPPLRANLLLSPEPFIATLHNRALQLFTPTTSSGAHMMKPSSTYLPAQVLVTLALASLKLGCTAVGRGMIEDWLARRPRYAKVMELYCLHVLPRLEDWDYAEDFLQYERELAPDTRKYMMSSLRSLRIQAMSSQPPPTTKGLPTSTSEPTLSTSRSVSPARSDSSASSSSSGSTHTATPTTPRPSGKSKAALPPVSRMTSIPPSASSQSISSTTTSRTVTPSNAHATSPRRRSRSANRSKAVNGGADVSLDTPRATTPVPHPLPRLPRAAPLEAPAPLRVPSALALIRTSCAALTRGMSRTKLAAYVLVFVVVPLLSFVLRVRRRRGRPASANGGGTVEEVRRRLRNAGVGEGKGVVTRAWEELLRAVGDTVQMGGRGLV